MADAKERGCWKDYMRAYEDAIRHTATPEAPWFVVPADNKWFTRVIVAGAVIDALAEPRPALPEGRQGEEEDSPTRALRSRRSKRRTAVSPQGAAPSAPVGAERIRRCSRRRRRGASPAISRSTSFANRSNTPVPIAALAAGGAVGVAGDLARRDAHLGELGGEGGHPRARDGHESSSSGRASHYRRWRRSEMPDGA